jgi:hypothetical protein
MLTKRSRRLSLAYQKRCMMPRIMNTRPCAFMNRLRASASARVAVSRETDRPLQRRDSTAGHRVIEAFARCRRDDARGIAGQRRHRDRCPSDAAASSESERPRGGSFRVPAARPAASRSAGRYRCGWKIPSALPRRCWWCRHAETPSRRSPVTACPGSRRRIGCRRSPASANGRSRGTRTRTGLRRHPARTDAPLPTRRHPRL